MKDDFLEIVAVIVRQMTEDEGGPPKGRSIIEGLLSEGYDLMDIDDALSWFESVAGSGEEMSGVSFWPGFKGVRVQTRWEQDAMTKEAFDYLMRLNAAGLLEDSFREAVLDKIVDLSIKGFGLEQMKALLGLLLYSKGRIAPEGALPRPSHKGSGSLLN